MVVCTVPELVHPPDDSIISATRNGGQLNWIPSSSSFGWGIGGGLDGIYCDRALLVQSQWWWILSGLLCTTCCSPPCPRRSSWAELSWAELGQSMVRLCCDLLSCVAENFLFIAKERQRERVAKGGHCDGSSKNVRSWSGEERRSSSHHRSSTQLKLELIYGPLQMANHVLLLLLRSPLHGCWRSNQKLYK